MGELVVDNVLNAYKGKRVLVTGHTGFKGSWLTLLLKLIGAEVMGYALEPDYPNSHYEYHAKETMMIMMLHVNITHAKETMLRFSISFFFFFAPFS